MNKIIDVYSLEAFDCWCRTIYIEDATSVFFIRRTQHGYNLPNNINVRHEHNL